MRGVEGDLTRCDRFDEYSELFSCPRIVGFRSSVRFVAQRVGKAVGCGKPISVAIVLHQRRTSTYTKADRAHEFTLVQREEHVPGFEVQVKE